MCASGRARSGVITASRWNPCLRLSKAPIISQIKGRSVQENLGLIYPEICGFLHNVALHCACCYSCFQMVFVRTGPGTNRTGGVGGEEEGRRGRGGGGEEVGRRGGGGGVGWGRARAGEWVVMGVHKQASIPVEWD